MSSDTRLAEPRTRLTAPRSRRASTGATSRSSRTSPAVLEGRPGGIAERLAARFDGKPAALAFIVVLAAGYLTVAAVSVAIGWLVIHVLLHVAWVSSADENVVVWFVHHRSPTGTDASVVGSTLAGGLVLPVLVATVAVVCVAIRRWRIAAFVVFALALESALYRTRHAARPSPATDRAPPRGPAGKRELPVRTHGRIDRGVRRVSCSC